MKKFALSLSALVFLLPATFGGQEKPLPPARQELKNYQAAHPDVPPSVLPHRQDPVHLQQEAAELASLAQSIPPDLEGISKGLLPSDLPDKLKRIEKISKHLRGELVP